jgi:hypothetical protein
MEVMLRMFLTFIASTHWKNTPWLIEHEVRIGAERLL